MARKPSVDVSKGQVLTALRAKVGPTGHIRRARNQVHAGTMSTSGLFTPMVKPSFTWEGLLKSVNRLKQRRF